MEVSIALVPSFLTASSAAGLRRAMLLNNIKRGAFLRYQDIQFINGKWICWYYQSDITNEDLIGADNEPMKKKGSK